MCDKVVLLLCGAGGVMSYSAPQRPLRGLALLAFTLVTRLRAVGLAPPRRHRAPLTANAAGPSVPRPAVAGREARSGSDASISQPYR